MERLAIRSRRPDAQMSVPPNGSGCSRVSVSLIYSDLQVHYSPAKSLGFQCRAEMESGVFVCLVILFYVPYVR